MTNLKTFPGTNIINNILLNDSKDGFIKSFIEPLKELGYHFLKYGHVGDDEMGTHILTFSHEGINGPITPDNEKQDKVNWESMVQIATRIVDDQPHATFRYYKGTLFVYVPYFI